MRSEQITEYWSLCWYENAEWPPYLSHSDSNAKVNTFTINDDGDVEIEINAYYEGTQTAYVPMKAIVALVKAHEEWVHESATCGVVR
jgi:hypothetical protein